MKRNIFSRFFSIVGYSAMLQEYSILTLNAVDGSVISHLHGH